MSVARAGDKRSLAFIVAFATMLALAVPFAGGALAQLPGQLDVTPETASNPTGTQHTLIAVAAVGSEIDFEIDCVTECAGAGYTVAATGGATATAQVGGPVTAPETGVDGNQAGGQTDDIRTTPEMSCTATDDGVGLLTDGCIVVYSRSDAGQDEVIGWIDADTSNTTVEADATEQQNTAGADTEPDDTDVVTKDWFAAVPLDATLDCSPDEALNPATPPGSAETYTCTLFNDNGAGAGGVSNDQIQNGTEAAIPGVRIDGENAGGANDTDTVGQPSSPLVPPNIATADYNDCGTTNASGQAQCTVDAVEAEAGFANICFWADNDNDNLFLPGGAGDNNDPQANNDGQGCEEETPLATNDPDTTDVVSKMWAARGVAANVTLTPQNDQNQEGTAHTVTATVTDAFGTPVQGTEVQFSSTGRNSADPIAGCGDVTTNSSGQASCTYTDTGPNIPPNTACGGQCDDQITAFADNNSNDTDDGAADPHDTAAKFWFDQVPTAGSVEVDMAGTCQGIFSETATNSVGERHQLCTHVEDAAGNDLPGETVTFTTSGPGQFWSDANANQIVDPGELSNTTTGTTDAEGNVFVSIYSEEIGNQVVTATADQASDTGTKIWGPNPARNLDCGDDATNAPGTSHLVTCHATDNFGNPVDDALITAAEDGPGRFTASGCDATGFEGLDDCEFTDNNGDAEFETETNEGETGDQTMTFEIGDDDGDLDNTSDTDDPCDQAAGELDEDEEDASYMDDQSTDAPAGNCEDTVVKHWVPGATNGPAACRNRGTDENVIIGTNGDDVISGTSGRDVICAAGGDDVVNGRGGADLIQGNGGNDTIGGGGGKDNVSGNRGSDSASGNKGNDAVKGNDGEDSIKGNKGIDNLSGGGGDDTLQGGDGQDAIKGNGGNDTLRGGDGADSLSGGAGTDSCFGNAGNDTLVGCE